MNNRFSLLLAILFFSGLELLNAQVSKTIIVEHFTNSRCGICSNRNPGFYANLDNHPNILHLSIHPSAPYSNCEFNLNNPSENDDRTNYYGIYGSTPKLVIQGENISASTNYGNAEMFAPYLEQTSPISIDIQQVKENNTVSATITLTVEETHNLGNFSLFVALAEDSVFYNAPNGEDLHRDVYRKNMSMGNGFEVNIPATVGESVTFEVSVDATSDWDYSRLYTLAILQETDTKAVVQVAAVSPEMNVMPPSATKDIELTGLSVFPVPTRDFLMVSLEDNIAAEMRMYDTFGRLVLKQDFQGQIQVGLSDFAKGIYLLEVINENGKSVRKVVVE